MKTSTLALELEVECSGYTAEVWNGAGREPKMRRLTKGQSEGSEGQSEGFEGPPESS